MSVEKFLQVLPNANYGKADKDWFPRWIKRYASWSGIQAGLLPLSPDAAIRFSQSLLKNGNPAWQRLQAIRAIEAYRNLILDSPEPSFAQIIAKLRQIAAKEKATGDSGVDNAAEVVGETIPT